MSKYRETARLEDKPLPEIVAVTGNDSQAAISFAVVAGLGALAACALLIMSWGTDQASGVRAIAAVLFAVTLVLGFVMHRYARRATMTISDGVFKAQGANLGLGADYTCAMKDLRTVSGEYRRPGLALALGMTLVAGARAQPQPMLTLDLDFGKQEFNTSSYGASPDLIARRLRRYLRKGGAALRPSIKDIETQIRRHAKPVTLTGSFVSRLMGTRIVEIGPEGVRVGNRASNLKLHRWQQITAAHILFNFNGGRIIQVELADGGVIRLHGSYGIAREELICMLSAHAYDECGDRIRPDKDEADEAKASIEPTPADRPKKKKKKPAAKTEPVEELAANS